MTQLSILHNREHIANPLIVQVERVPVDYFKHLICHAICYHFCYPFSVILKQSPMRIRSPQPHVMSSLYNRFIIRYFVLNHLDTVFVS